MIHFLNDPRSFYYTNRTYLNQWFFEDTLVITDIDINQEANLKSSIDRHWCKNVIVDLSHNQMPADQVPSFLSNHVTLTSEYLDWYEPRQPNYYYFPLWIWMFNLRTNQFFKPMCFDAHGRKTRPMMCLNRNQNLHRTKFREHIASIRDKIVYTWADKILPDDHLAHDGMAEIDAAVGKKVYSECAVNIVTESVVDRFALSEKSVKPFVARQIPVLLGSQRINQFYTDLGLDMFPDLVPWQTWDNESDVDVRSQKIADFVIQWYRSGSVLADYKKMCKRVERNKQYFHSEKFRRIFLKRMLDASPY